MCQIDDYFHGALSRFAPSDSAWTGAAIADLLGERDEHAETPLLPLTLPGFPQIRFLLKDESAHPSGSLKHRLARSLLLHALAEGRLAQGQAVIDASSGSTAISEAWFARRLGLPFHAVMPRTTCRPKQDAVAALGGECVLVDPGDDTVAVARAIAADLGACFLDQFGLAAAATDWRGDRNIAASMLAQCRALDGRDPTWIVCGAGTGGTSSTIGRHLRHVGSAARVCVADPTGAAFARGWETGGRLVRATRPTCIEGIGRQRVEPCFDFAHVDAVAQVDDDASIAGAWALEHWLGQRYGGSSGTNLAAAMELAAAMAARGERGSIALLLCDRGERYADTVFKRSWVGQQGLNPEPRLSALERSARGGALPGSAVIATHEPVAA
jgi:cysteine synthase A